MSQHVYVYCAVEGVFPALPETGMPHGDPPRAVPLDDEIALIVSTVPPSLYNAAALEARLQDLDWVSAAGGAHHEVVESLADAGATVLPFRLFTIFSSEDAATTALRGSRAPMAQAFDRVRGRQEWVLRIGKPDPARVESQPPVAPSRASGTSFLQAKADARREAAARAERVATDAAGARQEVARFADAATSRPVDPAGTLIIDAAFLVDPARVAAMRDALNRAAERLLRDGCPVSLTGPWPPYSFASMDPADA